MALINCPNCNKSVSDQAVSCPKCGAKLKDNQSVLKFDWARTWLAMDYTLQVFINGVSSQRVSLKAGCDGSLFLDGGETEVQVKCSELFINDRFSFYAEPGKNYILHTHCSHILMCYKYWITDEYGNIVVSKSYSLQKSAFSISVYIISLCLLAFCVLKGLKVI